MDPGRHGHAYFLGRTGETPMPDTWPPSLIAAPLQEGFDLTVKLARIGVKVTQPSD
jgi:hypothetical protein